MTRWVDVDLTVRVYLPDTSTGEVDADDVAASLDVQVGYLPGARGADASVLGADVGELCDDDADPAHDPAAGAR